jgi:transcriptional regulator with XRE-family HTH domain
MKTANELLGTRIRELRKAKGIAQEQLAEVLGIEQQYMSRIELGKSYPSLDRLIRISESLDVPLPSLFEFDYLENEGVRVERVEEMFRNLGEKDQQKIFRIVKMFREG